MWLIGFVRFKEGAQGGRQRRLMKNGPGDGCIKVKLIGRRVIGQQGKLGQRVGPWHIATLLNAKHGAAVVRDGTLVVKVRTAVFGYFTGGTGLFVGGKAGLKLEGAKFLAARLFQHQVVMHASLDGMLKQHVTGKAGIIHAPHSD